MNKQTINSVKILQDSITPKGSRLVSFEIETYRYIWSEVMTHKMLAKNAQSSRAVPVNSVLGINESNPVKPIVWGKNKGGMSASEVLEGEALFHADRIWGDAAQMAFSATKSLNDIGLHKMWANRITEPFCRIKAVISGTEWDNFFWLRIDPDAAQPEIADLATMMKAAYDSNKPMSLNAGDVHAPYVHRERDSDGVLRYFTDESKEHELDLELAMKFSASCNAQVSYRKLNTSFEKVMEIYDRLFDGAKPHYSPTEHIGIVMEDEYLHYVDFSEPWQKGVSHMDRKGYCWSGNLKGFIQYRKLLELK